MINIKSTQIFLLNSLAVPRLGNVQLRFHFLRRGTSGVNIIHKGAATLHKVQVSDLLGRCVGTYNNINSKQFTLPINPQQKGIYLIKVLDSDGKVLTSKLQR